MFFFGGYWLPPRQRCLLPTMLLLRAGRYSRLPGAAGRAAPPGGVSPSGAPPSAGLTNPYRTSIPARESRAGRTVLSADRVSHSVDRPDAFLHVLRAAGSAQIRQSPEHSIPVMHALESELNLIIRKCPGCIISESVRIPVYSYTISTYEMER